VAFSSSKRIESKEKLKAPWGGEKLEHPVEAVIERIDKKGRTVREYESSYILPPKHFGNTPYFRYFEMVIKDKLSELSLKHEKELEKKFGYNLVDFKVSHQSVAVSEKDENSENQYTRYVIRTYIPSLSKIGELSPENWKQLFEEDLRSFHEEVKKETKELAEKYSKEWKEYLRNPL
jgi:GTPase SAR1 family protein